MRRTLAVTIGVLAAALASAGCSSTVQVGAGSGGAPVVCPSVEPAPAEPGSSYTLTSGGIERPYYLWVPQRATTRPTPLVIDYHGAGVPAFAYANDFSPMADVGPGRGYIVVAPQAASVGETASHWAVPGFDATVDDVRFTQDLVAQLAKDYCVDPDRIYATGVADGAAMAAVMSCRTSMLAAVAPVAGVNLARTCPERPPVSVIAFHGQQDQTAPVEGVPGIDDAAGTGFFAGALDQVMAGWAARGGCSVESPQQVVVTDDVYRQAWSGCATGIGVELYLGTDAGATYPGGKAWSEYLEGILGSTEDAGGQTNNIHAAELILDFFDTHARVPG